jgi:hypothetical protein
VNNNNKLYLYFGIVVNRLSGITSTSTTLNFTELELFGKEFINYIPIYASSNVVKTIVEFDMPVVKKHRKFYCVVETPILINGITFYKYDVDLSKYISKALMPFTNDPYRIFNIQAFYGSLYFSTITNGLYDIIDTTIYMSYRENPSQFGVAGLNIYNYGNINNPNLQSISPNNLFLMRNGANSIDYITIVSRSIADVKIIISDMIG